MPLSWHRLLWTPHTSPAFLAGIVFCCVLTYLVTIVALRGARQRAAAVHLRVSRLLALGSVAGDTMFYGVTSVLYAVVVTGMYWLFNRLTRRYPRLSDWLEGAPLLVIGDGQIQLANFNQLRLTQKLFGELRQQQVEPLGQVRRACLEATGNLSLFFYPAAEPVRAGLPIWPERCAPPAPGHYPRRLRLPPLQPRATAGHRLRQLLPPRVAADLRHRADRLRLLGSL